MGEKNKVICIPRYHKLRNIKPNEREIEKKKENEEQDHFNAQKEDKSKATGNALSEIVKGKEIKRYHSSKIINR